MLSNDAQAESSLQGGAKKAAVARTRGPVVTFVVAVAASLALFAFAAIQLGLLHGLPGTPVTSAAPVAPTAPTQVELELLQLRERFDTFSSALGLLVAILVAVLAFGGISSASSWFNFEKRAEGLHQLNIEGQEAFLAGSRDTLTLVNTTLTLANEASGRAAKLVQERAHEKLRDLERRAKRILLGAGGVAPVSWRP